MKTYKKNYIGKGTQVGTMDIVRISVKLEDLAKLSHNYEGTDYVTFEVAKLQSPDNFGHTHTAYVNKLVEEDDKPAKGSKKAKKAPRTPAPDGDLPF
jgi:hypothetical protein